MKPKTPRDPDPQSLDVNGSRLHFTESGAGRPVVAIHGLPATSRVFRWFDAALDEKVRLFRIDLPGFGNSPALDPAPHDPAGYGEVIAGFCEAAKLHDVVVLGHSMGGVAAIDAATRSERITALALVNSSGPINHKGNFPRAYRAMLRVTDRHRLLEMALLTLAKPVLHRLGFSRQIDDSSLVLATRLCAYFDPSKLRDQLRSLDKPVFVSWSPIDPMVQVAVSKGLLASCQDVHSQEIAAKTHALPITHAIELADELVSWLHGSRVTSGLR